MHTRHGRAAAADASTVLLDGVRVLTGVAAWRDGVLVTAAGEIFYAGDTNDDGKIDVRDAVQRPAA